MRQFFFLRNSGRVLTVLAVACALSRPVCSAQSLLAEATGTSRSGDTWDTASLPDAPSTQLKASTFAGDAQAIATETAPKFHRTIQPNQTAQDLTAGDKLVLSLRTRASATSLAGTFLSAGFDHLRNGRPHYGSDKGAFGERLGASALTSTSRAVFTYGIYASIFHQDPRYYVMGNQHGFAKRVVYSASRVVLQGKPDGATHVNISSILGTASSSALANAYYPAVDRSFSKSTTSFLSSLGTQAALTVLTEFTGDIKRKFRHKN